MQRSPPPNRLPLSRQLKPQYNNGRMPYETVARKNPFRHRPAVFIPLADVTHSTTDTPKRVKHTPLKPLNKHCLYIGVAQLHQPAVTSAPQKTVHGISKERNLVAEAWALLTKNSGVFTKTSRPGNFPQTIVLCRCRESWQRHPSPALITITWRPRLHAGQPGGVCC